MMGWLDRHSQFLQAKVRSHHVVLLAALYLFWVAVMMPIASSGFMYEGGPTPLDLSFAYSAQAAFERLEAFTAQQRESYLWFELSVDMAYPIIYTAFSSAALAFVAKRQSLPVTSRSLIVALPIGLFLSDLLENATIVTMLLLFPKTVTALGWAASAFTTLKWSFAAATFGSLIVLTIRWAIFRIGDRNAKPKV